MATPTYDLIEEKVLGSAQVSVTFSSIPGTYKDLVLEMFVRTDRSAGVDSLKIQFNNDTASNYSYTRLISNTGASPQVVSDRTPNTTFFGDAIVADANATFAANTFTFCALNVMSYANTSVNKSVLLRASEAQQANGVSANAILYRSTSAITRIDVASAYSSNFVSGSTFRLWGIA